MTGNWPAHGAAVCILLVFLSVCVFCLFVLVFSAVRRPARRSGRLMFVLQTVLLLFLTADLAALEEYNRSFYESGTAVLPAWFTRTPPAVHAVLFFFGTAVSVCYLVAIRRRSGTVFSPSGIRQAINNLPAGICFASADGRPLLTNRSMEAFSRELTGAGLQDLNGFWQFLENKNHVARRFPQGELPYAGDVTATLSDGRIIRFTKGTLRIRGQVFTEVLASDLTQQYRLYEALSKDNSVLAEQRRKLRALSESLEQMNHEEEVLRHKIRIHNEIGRTVLATRRFLSSESYSPENIKIYAVLWRELCDENRFMNSDETPDEAQALREIINAAEQIGCKICLHGIPPTDGDQGRVLRQILRESVINAVRHAGADTLDVEITAGDGQTWIRVRNNGRPPEGPVCEGGGLGALRRAVENAGGNMTVETQNAFVLTVTLPK